MISNEDKKKTEQYINQLTEKERKVLEIAKDHLGTSFNLLKSK